MEARVGEGAGGEDDSCRKPLKLECAGQEVEGDPLMAAGSAFSTQRTHWVLKFLELGLIDGGFSVREW